MKFAHVLTKWIGEGTPDDKWRPDIPPGFTRMSVVGDQYVDLAANCPKPNIALVLVEESREKHEGYIDGLKSNLNQIIIETWEDDGPIVPLASALKLKNFLIRQGMDEDMAKGITSAQEHRVDALLGQLDILDKRARRRLELEV